MTDRSGYVRLDYDREARYTDLPEASLAVCRYCHWAILLDQQEGGGPGKDWGAGDSETDARPSWPPNGGIGLDYGCGDHPANDDDGTWGHVPLFETIRVATTNDKGATE